MKKNDETSWGIALLTVVLTIPLIALRGFVLSCLWGWYVTRLGVRPISVVEAYGLSMTVSLFVPKEGSNSSSKDDNELPTAIVGSIAISLFALLFGWVGTYML